MLWKKEPLVDLAHSSCCRSHACRLFLQSATCCWLYGTTYRLRLVVIDETLDASAAAVVVVVVIAVAMCKIIHRYKV